MKIKSKLLTFTNLMVVTILLNTITNTQSAVASWDVGSYYTYEYQSTTYTEIEYLELGSSSIIETTATGFYDINITDVDNVTKDVTYDKFDSSGKSTYIESYDWDDLASSQITLSNMLTATYQWNLRTNETAMNTFDFSFIPVNFLDPNWTALNAHFVTVLNVSEIIDTVVDPYTMIVHNITFGDLLNSLPSYKIQGQESLSSALEQFTTTTTKWTFEFTLTSVFNYGFWNSTLDASVYDTYDESNLYFEVEYDSGGILKYYNYNYCLVQIFDDVKTTQNFISLLAFDKLPETKTSNFVYLIAIPALFITAVIVKKFKKN